MDREIKKVSTRSLVEFLAEAGQDGATSTTITEAHDLPAAYIPRSNHVNQILTRLQGRGEAEVLGTEPSHRYRKTPVRRWRLTPAGLARISRYDARDGRQQRAAEISAQMTERAAQRAETLGRVRAEITAMTIVNGGLGGFSPEWREAKVAELRAIPCSLAEIGLVLGITPERVRQIEAQWNSPV